MIKFAMNSSYLKRDMNDRLKTLKIEIIKGWRWVVFVWGVLGQMGGWRGIIQAFAKAIAVPLRRGFR